jgi:DnaJ-class molecular chaperone
VGDRTSAPAGRPGARGLSTASRYARRHVSSGDEETIEVPEDEPVPCTVCRGTGSLISNLGGSPSTVPCAWCEGTGTFLPDHDAQAAKRAAAAEAPADAGAPAEPQS